MGPWRIDVLDAYVAWIARHDPNIDEEIELVLWIGHAETYGPPEMQADGENLTATLDSGARILARAFAVPGDNEDVVRGYILILKVS